MILKNVNMSVIKYKTKYSSIIPGNYNKTIYRSI